MEIRRQTIEEFTEQLSSKAPTPGGGGASALAGAFGTALGQMVANLTVGKKKYMDVEPEIKELLEEMEQRKERFLRLAEEDARVFEPWPPATVCRPKQKKRRLIKNRQWNSICWQPAAYQRK